MSENVLTLSPGGQPLNQSLGFGAASVIVDNLTASYTVLPDTGKSIPPWTYGAVVSLQRGINRARASLLATTPAIPGPPVPDSLAVCTLTWTSLALPPSPGHLLQQSQYGVQNLVATVAGVANQTVGPATYPVPAGTMSIGFQPRLDAGRAIPAQLIIRGTQTRQQYVNTTSFSTTGGVQWFDFAVTDTSVDVTLTCNLLNPSAIDVLASPLVQAVDVQVPFGSSLPAQLTDGFGNAISIDNPSAGVRSVGVSLFDSTAAPWQQPNQTPNVSSFATTAGAYKNVIPKVGAGVKFLLFYLRFDLDAVSGGVFAVGTDGATANILGLNDNGKGPYIVGPFATAENYGLNGGVYVFTTSSVTARWHIAYSTQ